jgi:hypothetical protein
MKSSQTVPRCGLSPGVPDAEQLDLLEQARAARDVGVELVNGNTSAEWRDCCDRAIDELAASGRDFQAADIMLLGVPDPANPNSLGGAFHRASRAGIIECVGFEPSRRPTVHASIVRVWRGTGSAR